MGIIENLQHILTSRYGRDVRQAIHDSIEEGYNIAVQAQGTAETSADSAEAYAAAALASEQNAQDYMELAEQYKNEAFAGTPTGYSDLVAKVNSIYKQTASSFGLLDTVEGLALAHTIYGMSEQDGTPTPATPKEVKNAVANFKVVGKSLIPFPYSTGNGTISGITYTIQGDESIKGNGTATSNFNSYFPLIAKQKFSKSLLGKTINFFIEANGNSNVGIAITLYTGDEGETQSKYWTRNASGLIRTETIPNNITYWQVNIYVVQGSIISDLIMKPIITLAEDATFTQYETTSVSTGLTLRAIEVSSTDDYNLTVDGRYYVADTVDWSEDSGYSITRRIGNIDSYDSESLTTIWMSSKDVYAQGTTPTSGANVTYILTTTTSESITSAQAQALLGLKTYDEATSIDATGDVAPSVTLEYSKDRNTALALIGHNMAYINDLRIGELENA